MANLESIIKSIGDLPAIPHVASLVMEKVANPDTTPKEINEIISKDQGLTARVLKTANSSFYGRPRRITKLTEAVMTVGFSTIQSLVLTAAVRDLFKTFGLIDKLLWDHSLGVAFASRTIAKKFRFPRIEEAFLAGLLHDVGKVILNVQAPEKMTLVVQEVYNTPGGASFCEMEKQVFGFDHAELGQLVAKKWNFAEEIELVIGHHHQPRARQGIPPLTYIIDLANGICHKLEIGPTRNPDLNLVDLKSARILKLSEKILNGLAEEIGASIAADKGFS
jgi:putative nucleotidyltransferase with HDIG domain